MAFFIANALELLRRIINFGVENNLCTPIDFTIQLPAKNNEVTEYLEPDEAERFMKVLDDWSSQDVARMLKLAMVTGMRRGEIFKLEDRDADFTQSLIKIRDPKGGKPATIPLNNISGEIIQLQKTWRDKVFPGSPYIFPGRGGRERVDCSAVKRIKSRA